MSYMYLARSGSQLASQLHRSGVTAAVLHGVSWRQLYARYHTAFRLAATDAGHWGLLKPTALSSEPR